MNRLLPCAALILGVAACTPIRTATPVGEGGEAGSLSLDDRLARFAPVQVEADLDRLAPGERTTLDHLIAASKVMDRLFRRQAWEQNEKYAETLEGPALELFRIHVGLWDRIDGQPFVGSLERPSTAGYYPADMTREVFEKWIELHPDQTDALTGLFTMVEWKDGGLFAVPYSEYFAAELQRAASHLRSAADSTDNPSLATFLRSRADAFLSNDYYQSDMDWMDLDSNVEITIGPYETYEDRLFGYKAAFESFVTLVDRAESERLALYKAELPAMEAHLPIPEEMKNNNRGTESPIRVADLVFAAGDTRAGVQTIAFNLPNDERVREEKGSKKVLLQNVIKAKYHGILRPIAGEMVVPEQASLISADAFSNHTLFHELCHGLGPGRIVVDGRQTEVRLELKDLYTGLEEAKADIMGVYNQLLMIDKGLMPESVRQHLFPTWLAGLFRSIRFGVEEAHGKANAIQFNYMLEKGAIERDPRSGRYRAVLERCESATRELVRDICLLQARGDYPGTLEFYQAYAVVGSQLASDLERLESIPIDIRPIYAAD